MIGSSRMVSIDVMKNIFSPSRVHKGNMNFVSSRPSSIPETMRAILLKGHGDLDQLEMCEDYPRPQILAPSDVLVRVLASAVNNTDLNTRLGWYSKMESTKDAAWTGVSMKFPRIQGIDICGMILEVGKEVDERRIGERVLIEPCLMEVHGETKSPPWYLGSECDGGFADYVVVASRHAHAVKNTSLTSVELASFPCCYSTAENMLTRCQVQASDRVLITGASGGVGTAAIQLAKLRGATVVAVTSSLEKKGPLVALGADEVAVVERRNEEETGEESIRVPTSILEQVGPETVDVVLDLVAGSEFPQLLDVLKRHGRYAVSGAIAGPHVMLDVRTLYLKDLTFYGCTDLLAPVFKTLVRYIDEDKVKPVIAGIYPLEHIRKAQEDFAKKVHVGKLVLLVNGDAD